MTTGHHPIREIDFEKKIRHSGSERTNRVKLSRFGDRWFRFGRSRSLEPCSHKSGSEPEPLR
jgi:hypothetical protein